MSAPERLRCEDLSVRIAGRSLVQDLNLAVGPGDFLAVLGPNGVGKTLSLLTLAGLLQPAGGRVLIQGRALDDLSRPEIARRLGLMLQHQTDPFPTTVLETALLGRHSRNGLWRWESAKDRQLAREVLARVDLSGLEERTAGTLSGGERRRLALAMLLMQDPDLLMLDEPLNHLDPQHRFAVLACLKSLCLEGKAVIASLHDPMLAARYATHALLLHGDGSWDFGLAADTLTTDRLEALYATPFAAVRQGERTLLLPVPPADLTMDKSPQ